MSPVERLKCEPGFKFLFLILARPGEQPEPNLSIFCLKSGKLVKAFHQKKTENWSVYEAYTKRKKSINLLVAPVDGCIRSFYQETTVVSR